MKDIISSVFLALNSKFPGVGKHSLSFRCKIAGYYLLRELSHADVKYMRLVMGFLSDRIEKSTVPKNISEILAEVNDNPTNFHPHTLNPSRFLGLRNLGCTCYVNSLIQQLYHDPRIRGFILNRSRKVLGAPEIGEKQPDDKTSASSAGRNATLNFLSALVKLFGSLSTSSGATKYIDTVEFCRSIRDYSGRSINFNEQMDAQEFLGSVLDRLEEAFKQTPTLLSAFKEAAFGGQLVNQIIPHCNMRDHVSKRTESFASISIDVKNLDSIDQGLEQFVRGESLDGENQYFCEKCNTKVPATKQVLIETPPNLLTIHLKRFEFNYQTLSNEKINSKCSFPLELNIRPYCATMLQGDASDIHQVPLISDTLESIGSVIENCYIYDLVGIIVHEGSSDSGHYFSIIKVSSPIY